MADRQEPTIQSKASLLMGLAESLGQSRPTGAEGAIGVIGQLVSSVLRGAAVGRAHAMAEREMELARYIDSLNQTYSRIMEMDVDPETKSKASALYASAISKALTGTDIGKQVTQTSKRHPVLKFLAGAANLLTGMTKAEPTAIPVDELNQMQEILKQARPRAVTLSEATADLYGAVAKKVKEAGLVTANDLFADDEIRSKMVKVAQLGGNIEGALSILPQNLQQAYIASLPSDARRRALEESISKISPVVAIRTEPVGGQPRVVPASYIRTPEGKSRLVDMFGRELDQAEWKVYDPSMVRLQEVGGSLFVITGDQALPVLGPEGKPLKEPQLTFVGTNVGGVVFDKSTGDVKFVHDRQLLDILRQQNEIRRLQQAVAIRRLESQSERQVFDSVSRTVSQANQRLSELAANRPLYGPKPQPYLSVVSPLLPTLRAQMGKLSDPESIRAAFEAANDLVIRAARMDAEDLPASPTATDRNKFANFLNDVASTTAHFGPDYTQAVLEATVPYYWNKLVEYQKKIGRPGVTIDRYVTGTLIPRLREGATIAEPPMQAIIRLAIDGHIRLPEDPSEAARLWNQYLSPYRGRVRLFQRLGGTTAE